jgi:hypothetical protein
MLSNEVMGALALAILWVNTMLVALAACQSLAKLAARRASLRPLGEGETGLGLVEGEIASGSGDDGALAVHRVEQVGRQAADDADRPAILFSDRRYAGEVHGGVVTIGARRARVAPDATATVWMPIEALRDAAACPSASAFDAAYAQAKKARGHVRTVEAKARAGARVWIFGEVRRDGDGLAIAPPEGGSLLVATLDPRAACSARIAQLVAFVAAVPLVAAACTFVSLQRPHFGLVSTIGGALCLAYFLLVQPAGTAIRDRVLEPSRTILRGSWVREGRTAASEPTRAAEAS